MAIYDQYNSYVESTKIVYKQLPFVKTGTQWLNTKVEDPGNIFIFLAADYGNIGDLAITYAMTQLALETNDHNVFEIPVNNTVEGINAVKKMIQPHDEIWLVGGGNMGSDYDMIEGCRRLVISCFLDNTIISFPQSVDFKNTARGIKHEQLSKLTYELHQSLVLMARGSVSLSNMQAIFPDVYSVQSPDVVLSLKSELNNDPIIPAPSDRLGIKLCMRNDIESVTSQDDIRKLIIGRLPIAGVFDTHLGTGVRFTEFESKFKAIAGCLQRFNESQLVITDRLHGMIFAHLTDTPCIVLPSANHKIKECRDTFESSTIHLVDSPDFDHDLVFQYFS